MEIDEKIRVDKITKERWTDAKTKSFIKRYIELPSLWNISDPNYAQKANVSFYCLGACWILTIVFAILERSCL